MKRLVILAVLVIIAGCHGKVADRSQGHWGDRSSWQDRDPYTQDYFADNDSHEIGYIHHYSDALDIEAHCDFGTRKKDWDTEIGTFETPEDAQDAIEKLCKETP